MTKIMYNKKDEEVTIMRVKPLHIIDRFRLLFDGWKGFFSPIMTKPLEKG